MKSSFFKYLFIIISVVISVLLGCVVASEQNACYEKDQLVNMKQQGYEIPENIWRLWFED